MHQSNFRQVYSFLIIALINTSVLFALFLFRSLDDNRLTSWKWVFLHTDVTSIFPIFLVGLLLAYILGKIHILERTPIALFVLSFAGATAFWSEPEVIVDASRYFTQAKHLEIYGVGYFFEAWGKEITAWTDLPLIPFIYGVIFKFFGEQRVFIQIFTTLLFSLTVMLTYGIGKALWDRNIGFIAGLLLLGIPYLFSQVPLMLVDVPTMFFLALSIFTLVKALEQGGAKWVIVAAFAVFLAVFSKFSSWLWLSVLLVIFLVHLKRNPIGTFKRGGFIAMLSLLFVGTVILWNYEVMADQIRLLLDYQRPGLRRWGESLASTFFFQIHPFITVSALCSIFVAFKKRDPKYIIAAYLFLLILLLQVKRIRYTLPLFPMITLMASYGLAQIRNREIMRYVVFCIIISSFVLAYFAYLPFLHRISTVNLKEAGKFLNLQEVERVEVFTLPQVKSIINPAISVPLLDLFTDKSISYSMKTDLARFGERVEKSSLRFTWAYKNPAYYGKGDTDRRGPVGLVVISSTPGQSLPKELEKRTKAYAKSETFMTSSGVFRYQTLVTVYSD